ncbi:zinc-finger domain-containing protein [Aestuariivirga litoralis]|uniref:zinc-finger domain-containing protein n=1 Tax=Aestuariivirga litoralis TaxID=2650924 RepID=UPI0018C6E603|nr:zinc-finger domain-containing protein [Aestuariivirga litoralis]MBG1231288.1 zinc-finger domain-containing protein [Aestuariivirga litoralis]
MAQGATPHFQNSMGLAVIEISAKEFMCVGAKPPFDHPHVFIDMGKAEDTVCPYCSTLYKFNGSLPAGTAKPAEALWHDEAA